MINKSKILVTGGAGFLGRHVVKALLDHGVPEGNIAVPRSSVFDLRKPEACSEVVKGMDIVIHLAGRIGGISFNQAYPASSFYDNLKMGMQLMEAARQAGVKKFVVIGTACEYPKLAPTPFKEDDIWNGYPAEETAPYGLAKKMLLVQGQTYREQYGFDAIHLIPTNLYGPEDNFGSEYNHVIPSLIKRICDAKEARSGSVDVWGAGTATREFLYAEDAAEGIVLATEKYDKPLPVNLGTGIETSIKELVQTISSIVGFSGEIKWDASKPEGTPRRCLDVARAYEEFGFKAKVGLKKGLEKTIDWYLKTKQAPD
jgi:GDP-L-fucose synthase